MSLSPLRLGTAFLESFGQIAFQSHKGSSLLIIAALFWLSPTLLALASLGIVVSIASALLVDKLSPSSAPQRLDLYGFNGALVALALSVLAAAALWLIVLGAVLSTVLRALWVRRSDTPAYTFPFVLSTYAVLAAASLVGIEGSLTVPLSGFEPTNPLLELFAQLLFAPHAGVGLLLWLAILLGSRREGLWTLVGILSAYVLGLGLAQVFPATLAPLDLSLLGYNSLLLLMTLCQLKAPRAQLISALVLAPLLSFALLFFALPLLSAPFLLGLVLLRWRRAPTAVN